MIKLVDRYIGRAAILGTMVVWLGLTLLFVLFSLLSELRDTQAEYTSLDAMWVVILTLPRLAYQIFPVAALLGALIGVGGLAASNELVAFRTSGVSRVRLASAAIGGALLLTVPVMILGEYLAPAAEQQARAFRLSEMVGQAIIGGTTGVWMRDGTDIVNIQAPILSADRGQQSLEFKDIVIYHFDEGVNLARITRAASASHQGGAWELDQVSAVSFSESGAFASQHEKLPWSTEVRPELLDSVVTRPKRLSIRSLLDYLDYLKANGLDDTMYQSALWEKLVFPFTVIALVLAGMPFVFGQGRSQNIGVRMFLGMVLGGGFLIVTRMAQNFGDVYHLSALLSHILPPLLLASVAIYFLRRTV
ncbi:MAG: LPS export ABC transporter permease LptG [Xanthomonadales bacterium]|nr:LPS export ABC transporter permease LptG [Xanthomonadales bacterium]